MKGGKVLLTGGSGFIGLKTLNLLRKKGWEVRLFEGDIRKVEDWKKSIGGGEVLLHLAGARTETDQDFQINLGGIESLFKAFEAGARWPVRIVNGSSQAVYKGINPPFKEGMKPLPVTTYGRSKLAAEEHLIRNGKRFGIEVVILRYSTVLGPGIRPESTMSGPLIKWIDAAVTGKEIVVFQDGRQTRDYVHVDDVAEANLIALNKLPGGIYNVGGGKEVELLELAKTVKKETKSKSEIRVVGGRSTEDDPRRMLSDISKLKKYGWRPKKSVRQAVGDCVKGIN